MKHIGLLLIISLFCLWSCKVDPKINKPIPSDDLAEIIPEGWPQPTYRFTNNPISEETFVLGRSLFYDPILSLDNTISCGSCHQQFVAFANADHNLSHGIDGLLGTRNSPALFNLAWYNIFMHDGGINHIEIQPVATIENPVEMGLSFSEALNKLRSSQKYVKMFSDAYGSQEITGDKMLKAMAQFMALMYSNNSKFDNWKRGQNNINLSQAERRGYQTFLAKCNICHTEPLFTDLSFRSNGLSVSTTLRDSGRFYITRLYQDRWKFKVPSLRNIALTGPYMHDGRYQTLQQCMDHYTDHVTNLENLDPLLQPGGIPLSSSEKADLIEFLQTLTDYKFINDKRFSDPRN
jgi:cytochrome c peroxidase